MTATAYLLPSEAQPIIGISPRSLRRALSRGELPALRLNHGRRPIYRLPATALGVNAPAVGDLIRPMMTTRAVCELVRLHPYTVQLWATSGVIPMERTNGQWRISGESFRQWLDAHSVDVEEARQSRASIPSGRTPPQPLEPKPRGANPTRKAREPFVVPARWFDCAAYDRCLNTAVERDWSSWDCSRCRLCPAGVVAQPLSDLPMVGLEQRDEERNAHVLSLMRLKP